LGKWRGQGKVLFPKQVTYNEETEYKLLRETPAHVISI
jgi:hypothetical protein